MKRIYSLMTGVLCSVFAFAQSNRYLEEVFNDGQITISTNVMYGVNLSIWPTVLGSFSGQQVPPGLDTLLMDVYQPSQSVDNLNQRPLLIYIPTGNFLAPGFNGSPQGNIKDSSAVNFAKKAAKRGYVCAVIEYRWGWNPLAADLIVRTSTILNAAYKGQQDSKAAVRFFRKDAATDNVFKIDPNRIALVGEGTGGYIAMAHAYLDRPWKIGRLPGIGDDKFLLSQNPDVSVIDTLKIGNFDGDNSIAIDLSLFAQTGNLLNVIGNIANHPGYSSNVNLCINLGGALGDTSWLDPGQIPLIGVHAVRDPNAPYQIGDVIVPTTGNLVIPFASGAGFNVPRMNQLNNNASFANRVYNDPITTKIESYYNQSIPFGAGNINTGSGPGLLPFILPTNANGTNHGSPWQFWNSNQPAAMFPVNTPGGVISTDSAGKLSNPFMALGNAAGRAAALLYIDTIHRYINPRVVCALNLTEQCNQFETTGTQKIDNGLVSLFPNPAHEMFYVRCIGSANHIQSVKVYSLTGKLVYTSDRINSTYHQINRQQWPAGIYMVEIQTREGRTTQRISIQ